jgi:hypothetical protein
MLITAEERAIAAAVVAAFNDGAGTAYSVEAHLGLIVGRVFEHPRLCADDHRAIVAAVFRAPWWSGRPGIALIYGNGVQFERALDAWRSARARTTEHSQYDSTTTEVNT